MEPLRTGILGAARLAEAGIVAPANGLGARLVGLAARDRVRAEGFAAQHGVERVFDTYEQMIEDSSIDAIYNPLANALHGPWNTGRGNCPNPYLGLDATVVTFTVDSAKRSVVGCDDREWVPFLQTVAPESHRSRLRRGDAR